MNTEKRFYMFFGMLTAVLLIVVGISMAIEFIFNSPEIELETFDFSKHGKLEFDDAYRGSSPESNITFALFSDFRCPACIEQYPTIKKLMINHSEVNFIFKHLTSDEESVFAATAYECAILQGKGFTLADFMFSYKFTKGDIVDYLEQVEMNMTQLVECLNSSTINTMVKADNYHAQYLEVRGSPTVFLNGIKIEGVHSYEVYDEIIRLEQR